MSDAIKAVKALKQARAQDLKTRAVRLSSRPRHYTTTKTKAQRDLQNAERINRNAPVKTIKADGEVRQDLFYDVQIKMTEDGWKFNTETGRWGKRWVR